VNRRPGSTAGSTSGSIGTGLLVIFLLLVAGLWAAFQLRLDPRNLWPGQGGWALTREFFQAAWHPALFFQEPTAASSFRDVPLQALRAAGMTVVFAATSLSLALVGGFLFGVLGSSAWHEEVPGCGRAWPLLTTACRSLMALMRAIHELIWAVVLLAALGSDPLVAVLAIAIPYTGTLAKVFSEMIDEAPRSAYTALRGGGASPWQSYLFGILPRALPDMLSYTFYRFECALRSSAVLGFFGFPTLGYYIAASFENLFFQEVWTYLYVLFALVVTMDWWSGRLRRELVS
jgi:phosphonate transport system permease protein